MKVAIYFEGEDVVGTKIMGFAERADDLRPAWTRVRNTLRRAATRQFDSEGVYGSGGWEPLAPSTVKEKAIRGLDPRIMHRTYRLRNSLTGDNADRIQRSNRQSFTYGTQVPYARYHQTGTSRMPQRKLVDLPKPDRKEITRAIFERIMSVNGRFDG